MIESESLLEQQICFGRDALLKSQLLRKRLLLLKKVIDNRN